MKYLGGKVAHRDPAVNEEPALRSAEQLPRFGAYLFAASIAIGINPARELWPSIPSTVMHRRFTVENRREVLLHCRRRGRLDNAADLAAAPFDDYRRHVCDPARLNGGDGFVELIV